MCIVSHRAFCLSGIASWNTLPARLRHSSLTLKQFKRLLRRHCLRDCHRTCFSDSYSCLLFVRFEVSLLLLWAPAQRKRATMLYFANVFLNFFLWPPYSPALVNGGSRKFYTWWTLSVIREVSSWLFSWSPLNYRVGQKVTKFGVFSDRTRKRSALTPERGGIL